MGDPAPARRRRSDAARNRGKIIAAARAAMGDPDVAELSMAEVARRADVGTATLYRNFPGRRELLEALFTDQVDALCAAAAENGGESPGVALSTWLRGFAVFLSGKHRIAAELLEHTDATDPLFSGSRNRVLAAGRPLLAAAQMAREARDDLSIEQALDLILATVSITGDHGYRETILDTVLAGIRTREPGRD